MRDRTNNNVEYVDERIAFIQDNFGPPFLDHPKAAI